MGTLLLASRDLMLSSRTEGAARKLGLTLVMAHDESQIYMLCAEENGPVVLLVDLRLPGLDIYQLVAAVRAGEGGSVPILACGPHVHEARLAAARKAGCDWVVTRGQLDRDLESLLQRAVASD